MSYENRLMQTEQQSGHPSGSSACPKCNAPLYFAAELKLHDRTEKNVLYCSGGCGFLHKILHGAKDGLKDAGIAALEIAGEFLAGGAGQE